VTEPVALSISQFRDAWRIFCAACPDAATGSANGSSSCSAARTHGRRSSFLHATDAGRPIYERMGYAEVTTHTAYLAAGGDVVAHS